MKQSFLCFVKFMKALSTVYKIYYRRNKRKSFEFAFFLNVGVIFFDNIFKFENFPRKLSLNGIPTQSLTQYTGTTVPVSSLKKKYIFESCSYLRDKKCFTVSKLLKYIFLIFPFQTL